MKQIFFLFFISIFVCDICFAEDISFRAREFGPEIVREDFKLAYASTVEKKGNYETKVLYIASYQIVHIEIFNESKNVLNINPNNFTLVSDANRSYTYSSETHSFKNEIHFLATNPLQAVDVYPGTMTDGFLLFDKRVEDERPKKLYFKNSERIFEIIVESDKIKDQIQKEKQ